MIHQCQVFVPFQCVFKGFNRKIIKKEKRVQFVTVREPFGIPISYQTLGVHKGQIIAIPLCHSDLPRGQF